jgi:hypothetical protein
MKKLILNKKIIFLSPKNTNEVINFPILLLNSEVLKITKIKIAIVDKKNKVMIFLSNNNINLIKDNNGDNDIYYIPINKDIIQELEIHSEKEEQKIIINDGYLENFLQKDSIIVDYILKEEN